MATLYELTGEFLTFSDYAESQDMTPEMVEVWNEALSNLADDIEDKIENYGKVIRNLESDIEALKAEEKRLHERRTTLENRVKSMKSAIRDAMKITDKPKIKGELFSFTIRKNPPSLVLEESYLENIPEEYLIPQEPIIDKEKIKEILKSDDQKAKERLEGIAHLETTESLLMR